jgi:Ni/Co efflux regulator RcnB
VTRLPVVVGIFLGERMRISQFFVAAMALLAMPGLLSSADAQADRDHRPQGHPPANQAPPNGGPSGDNRGSIVQARPHGPEPGPKAAPLGSSTNRSPYHLQSGNGSNGGSFNNHPAPARPAASRISGTRHDFSHFRDFHRNVTAARRFHAPQYRRPAGWYPHHWVFGEFLPSAFWIRNYWIANYIAYALSPPPYGAVWVRVGDDALLVDQTSGEIITVEYGVFY